MPNCLLALALVCFHSPTSHRSVLRRTLLYKSHAKIWASALDVDSDSSSYFVTHLPEESPDNVELKLRPGLHAALDAGAIGSSSRDLVPRLLARVAHAPRVARLPRCANATAVRSLRPKRLLTATAFCCAACLGAPRLLLAATTAPALVLLRYGTIPMVAGLLNMATNQLAVKMMFYPLRFVGIGRVGWQGIVPGKSLQMANKIVDDVMLRLINVRELFARLPPEQLARRFDPMVLRIGNELARELISARGHIISRLAAPFVGSAAFNETLLVQGRQLVADVVHQVQAAPEEAFSLRHLITSGFQADAGRLVRLFERCGEQDLAFVVRSGLWLGGALGVLQALLFYYWNPWWSLALTGALVGMVTDQLALKLIFEPVEPCVLGPIKLQGLFLQRQAEVSELFADFMEEEVTSPQLLWAELMHGANCEAFWSLLEARVVHFMNARPALRTVLGTRDFEWLCSELGRRAREQLPSEVYLVHSLTRESLQLRPLMTEKMQALSSAEFERVLHPVFEEDELTLILIGTALGGIAGALQARV